MRRDPAGFDVFQALVNRSEETNLLFDVLPRYGIRQLLNHFDGSFFIRHGFIIPKMRKRSQGVKTRGFIVAGGLTGLIGDAAFGGGFDVFDEFVEGASGGFQGRGLEFTAAAG